MNDDVMKASKAFSFDLDEDYAKRFQALRAKSQMAPCIKEMLRQHLPAAISEILRKATSVSSFNVLSIGAGTGDIDLEIIRIVREEMEDHNDYRKVRIYNRAIEPNGSHLATYEDSSKNLSELESSQVTFDLRKKTFEEYKNTTTDDPVRFDLVHFVHSIYYVDMEDALLHCFGKELKEHGKVLAIVTGGRDLFYSVALQYRTALGFREEDIVQGLETIRPVMEIIAKHDWKREKYTREYSVEVTEVFDNDSIQGNLLLDFLTHKINYRKTTDEKTVHELLNLIKDLTYLEDGKRFGQLIDSILFIHK